MAHRHAQERETSQQVAAVLERLLDDALALTGATGALLAVCDQDGGRAVLVQRGLHAGFVSALEVPPRHRGSLGAMVKAADWIRVSDVPADLRSVGCSLDDVATRTFLGVPVDPAARRYATLQLAGKAGGGVFGEHDVRAAVTLAALAATTVEGTDLAAALVDAERVSRRSQAAAEQERERVRGELLARVITAQENERARVARDLHDEVGQALTSVLLALRLVEGALAGPGFDVAAAQQRAGEVRALVVDALAGVRQLAFELRPTVLDDLGLAAALEGFAADFTQRHGIALDVAVDGLTDEPRLPAPVETVIYRVVQEALTNVARHARANRASLVVRRTAQRVRAIVEDDGIGFDPATAGSEALGLRGMTERASAVGGSVEVASRPYAGASVTLEVPLD